MTITCVILRTRIDFKLTSSAVALSSSLPLGRALKNCAPALDPRCVSCSKLWAYFVEGTPMENKLELALRVYAEKQE